MPASPPSVVPAVEVDDLRVTLGDHPVLRGVTLRIPQGKMVAIIGPNGSGKTTLLRCLLGLQKPGSGTIRLLGQPVSTEVLQRTGYVPQRLAIDPSFSLSVREFLVVRSGTTSSWFWRRKSQLDERLRTQLAEVGASDVLDRPLHGLSGGQLQRVLIAAAISHNPELLLLDEPTAGVDTPGEQDFYDLMGRIHEKRRMTVVLVSHDLSMVYRRAAWIYALNGVICCEGTPDQVMNAESLKRAYGIHVTPFRHHDHETRPADDQPIRFHAR